MVLFLSWELICEINEEVVSFLSFLEFDKSKIDSSAPPHFPPVSPPPPLLHPTKIDRFSSTRSLVACTRLYTPLCPLVGPSFGRSHLTFLAFTGCFTLLLLMVSYHCTCEPACHLGSCVSGLVS